MSQTSFLKRKKILVVEDHPDLLELLRMEFKDKGFAIATANNGVDAIRKARSLLPDLILLDVILPELDGFAVCEILRKDPATAATPIMMLTGLPGQVSRCAGIESGATDFLAKPISPAAIVSKVKDFFLKQNVTARAVTAESARA
jgi:DNA-binding response OmpR family regulator